jgi:tungstate transport system ATP-binding protein
MGKSAVSISELNIAYNRQEVLNLEALDFEEGRVHVLIGPNGSGKTTLLRAIAGIQKPDSGAVSLFGQNLYKLPRKEFIRAIRTVTLCFQKPYLFNISVRQNLEYGLRFRDLSVSRKKEQMQAAANALALGPFLERNAHSLSAGETQRVAIARVIALRPRIALLDEPVASVDISNKSRVESAIARLQESGSTVIVATHQVEQAYRLSANVVRLENGRVAPPAIENLLEGEIAEENGSSIFNVGGSFSVYVVSGKRGAARAAIDPAGIIISKDSISSSARNSLPGRVVALSELNRRVSVTVDTGMKLVAHITPESFKNLGITLGSEVFLTFKASAVTVF